MELDRIVCSNFCARQDTNFIASVMKKKAMVCTNVSWPDLVSLVQSLTSRGMGAALRFV